GDAGDAEVGDLDPAMRGDQQVSRLDVPMDQPSGVRRVQSGSRLGDEVEHAVGGEYAFALEDRGECPTGHQLQHQLGPALLFAVVEDVGDAFVVDQRGVAGFSAEALEKTRIAHVFVFQDLDGDGAADDQVGGLPDFAHAADGDSGRQLVPPTESEATSGS